MIWITFGWGCLQAIEKYLQPEHYRDGQDGADNEHMYIGADNDLNRIVYCTATQYRPQQDKRGYNNTKIFGSAHVGSSGSGIDTTLAVYTGNSVSALTLNDNARHSGTSTVIDPSALVQPGVPP